VLGLLLGPSAGLYGIAKRSALAARGKAGALQCFREDDTSWEHRIVLPSWWQHGERRPSHAMPIWYPSVGLGTALYKKPEFLSLFVFIYLLSRPAAPSWGA
jgi:hypothetical protein